jgi:hypothetical protein
MVMVLAMAMAMTMVWFGLIGLGSSQYFKVPQLPQKILLT